MQEIKEYVAEKKLKLAEEIKLMNKKLKAVIVQVGNVEASNRYVRNKIKDLEEVGIEAELKHFDDTITEDELLNELKKLDGDQDVTGYLVQLPLPKHINEATIALAVSPNKDIDGFHPLSKTNPATPQGIITYLEDQGYDFVNKNAVVIGRSAIVGRPIARLLLDRSCNVTVIHSKTSNSRKLQLIECADLIIVATGHRNTLTDNDLFIYRKTEETDKPDPKLDLWRPLRTCFIVDVGINFTEDGKLVGDCENVTVCEKTPVPGGVGLLTRLAVIENLIKLSKEC